MAKVAKVYATDPGAKARLHVGGRSVRLSTTVGVVVSDEEAAQLEREIAGDPGCSDQREPCDECKRHCAEHEVLRVEWNEKNPDQAGLPHFGHVCAADAHRGHVGVAGRTDIKVVWEDATPAISGTTVVKGPVKAAVHTGEVVQSQPAEAKE
jgi:hypothetical protein